MFSNVFLWLASIFYMRKQVGKAEPNIRKILEDLNLANAL
jgi:hypothetical protein